MSLESGGGPIGESSEGGGGADEPTPGVLDGEGLLYGPELEEDLDGFGTKREPGCGVPWTGLVLLMRRLKSRIGKKGLSAMG